MDRFFKHFPLVQYGNSVANTVSVNIFAKVAFQKKIQENYEVFHPYTIREGDRADTIAHLYYGDPGYDWLVYYCNNIVDPYYDWYMDQDTFNRFITVKYGSLTDARTKIKFFRSNYATDDSMISVTAFNALSADQKRFWDPVVGINNSIIRYERKKEDVVFETNKIIQTNISLVGNTVFIEGEYVYQQSGTVTGSADVSFANSSLTILKNIIGTISTTYNLKGSESGANAVISSTNTLATSISSTIQSYFESNTFYEYENELNEKKKNIKLIDIAYVEAIQKEFKELLSS